MCRLMKREEGYTVVEATILLPFCFIMVIAVYYASLFLCAKANLQANLEMALTYYKNVESDSYVTVADSITYSSDGTTKKGTGSGYEVTGALFPYRFFGMNFDGGAFEQFFTSICKYAFFNAEDIEVKSKKTNYVIYKTIEATATQEVSPAIQLTLIGMDKDYKMTLVASGKVVINDTDDLINNMDFAADLFSSSELGKGASKAVDSVVEFYNQFKETFEIK